MPIFIHLFLEIENVIFLTNIYFKENEKHILS